MSSKIIVRAIVVGGALFCIVFSALPASAATSDPMLHQFKGVVFDDETPAPADPAPEPKPAPEPETN
jgi:hypothetical protein